HYHFSFHYRTSICSKMEHFKYSDNCVTMKRGSREGGLSMAYLNPLEQEIADIQQSWKRCYEFGLKPEEQADDQIVSERAVKELQQHYQFLFPHAEAVFAQLYPLITSYGCVVFLTDAEGTILYASGDASFASRAARVQLQVGANWHERKKGTNA